VLALPGVLRALAGALPESPSRPSPAEALATVVDVLDPDRTPWVALILAVGLARLPGLARSAVERRRSFPPAPGGAGLRLGAAAGRALRVAPGRRLGVAWSAAFVTFALAATDVTPALLLAPTAETRPVGPAVLNVMDEPGGGLARAGALALIAVAVNLL